MTAVVAIATPLTGHAAAPDPRFGAVNAYENGHRADELGVAWSRLMFRWDRVQRSGPGEWWPAVTEDVIDAEVRRGRKLAGILINTPQWAASDPTAPAFTSPPRGLYLPFDHPDNVWGEYVRRTASAYRGRIDVWIVWNEPDVWDAHHPGYTWSGSVADFYRLQKVAYQAARKGNPDATVVLPGLTYFWDMRGDRPHFIDRFLEVARDDPEATPNGSFFDAAVLQLYNDPWLLHEAPTTYRRIMQSHGIEKPIWINETNVAPWDDYDRPLTRAHFRADGLEQASYFIQAYALALVAGVERISLYKLADDPAWSYGWESYGLVRVDGSVRPAFAALRMVHALYNGAQGVGARTEDGVTLVTLRRPGERIVVAWSREPRSVTVRVGAAASVARLHTRDAATRDMRAHDGSHRLELGPATHNTAQARPDRFMVGGPPVILVERVDTPTEPSLVVEARGESTPPRTSPLSEALAALRDGLRWPVLAPPGR